MLDKRPQRKTDRQDGRKTLLGLVQSLGWLNRIRPQSLAEPLYRLLGPYERRRIIEWQNISIYTDPFSHLGRSLILRDEYEKEECDLIRQILKPGGIFLDIGANEGIFSAIATQIVGATGLVIAVEPQSRLCDILEINLILNGSGSFRIYNAAISDVDGMPIEISLTPISNTGGSSIVRKYRWSTKTETTTTKTIDSILNENNLKIVDLVKVDVEGSEYEVIKSAKMALSERAIKVLALDYHKSILDMSGVDAEALNKIVLSNGYKIVKGSPSRGGYVVYEVN